VVRRTRAGKSPLAPDRKHLHHRLLDIGHSHRSSVLIMYLWAALFSGGIVWLSVTRTPLFLLAVTTLAAILVLLLMSMPRLRWWERKRRARLAASGVMARGAASAAVAAAAAKTSATRPAPGAAAAAPLGAPVPPSPVSQNGTSPNVTAPNATVPNVAAPNGTARNGTAAASGHPTAYPPAVVGAPPWRPADAPDGGPPADQDRHREPLARPDYPAHR
jgi:UDP-GlcNAc:undecaprenyl-phosphate GlcNAc-1-phosphate transferase